MGTTRLSQRGSNRLTDRQARFVAEYTKDYNATRAAKEAGYKHPQVRGAELLKNPLVAASVGKIRRLDLSQFEIERGEILQQLHYLATRSGRDFVDENGRIITDARLLPERAAQAIDGIEQEETIYTDDEGNETRKIKTKLHLVPKAHAINMAMKHKGLFEADNAQKPAGLTLDLSQLWVKPPEPPNIVESKLAEQKRLIVLEQGGQ